MGNYRGTNQILFQGILRREYTGLIKSFFPDFAHCYSPCSFPKKIPGLPANKSIFSHIRACTTPEIYLFGKKPNDRQKGIFFARRIYIASQNLFAVSSNSNDPNYSLLFLAFQPIDPAEILILRFTIPNAIKKYNEVDKRSRSSFPEIKGFTIKNAYLCRQKGEFIRETNPNNYNVRTDPLNKGEMSLVENFLRSFYKHA
jgi:hypothetical protein